MIILKRGEYVAIIENYKEDVLYYQIKLFNDIEFIKHLFTSRIGWCNENTLNKLSNIFNVPRENIIKVKQVHGTDIMVIDSNTKDLKKIINLEKDGLITNTFNIVLTTSHADCVPIYFVDKEKEIIGLAHGGWRGTYNNISGKMIDKMIEVYDSNVKDILVGIGPSIGPCCYEVSKDLAEKFAIRYSDFKDIFMYKNGNIHLDLWRTNYFQLKEKGILEHNIVIGKACTSCHIDKFYSYRKEKGTKNRMVAAIGMFRDL